MGVRGATVWKLLGVAGLAGVAATGVVVARDQRRRQQLTPEEVRQRLLERHTGVTEPTGQRTVGPCSTG